MNTRARGVVLGVAQLIMVSALGGEFLLERARLPRAWVRAVPVPAETVLQGRYLRLQLAVDSYDVLPLSRDSTAWVTLFADSGRLRARAAPRHQGFPARQVVVDGLPRIVLRDRLDYFIPEHAVDPRTTAAGAELWVEVSVPAHGAPRPVRLGMKQPEGPITPLVIEPE